MGSLLATLSPSGWISSAAAKADQMFADFIVANNSQYPFASVEASLPWLLTRYQDNPRALEQGCSSALLEYFESNFQGAEVLVSVYAVPVADKPLNLDLRIGVQIKEDGKTYEVANSIKAGEGKVLEVAKIVNGTLPYTP